MLKRILVAITSSAGCEGKILTSVGLAKAHGASLTLVSVVNVEGLSNVGPVPIGAGHFAETMVARRLKEGHERARAALDRTAALAGEAGVPVEEHSYDGDPVDVLMGEFRYHDMLVLNLRDWFDHEILGGSEEGVLKLLSSGVRPVLAVGKEHKPVDKVMIAYNGSPESSKAMKHYLWMRLWGDTPIEIVCAGDASTEEAPERLLARAADFARAHGLEVTTYELPENTPEAILHRVEEIDADMVVMGGSYRRMLLQQRFGNCTHALFTKSEVPLFISH